VREAVEDGHLMVNVHQYKQKCVGLTQHDRNRGDSREREANVGEHDCDVKQEGLLSIYRKKSSSFYTYKERI
jgi:hypothetical protein